MCFHFSWVGRYLGLELLGHVVALCFTVVMLFLQAVTSVCGHKRGRRVEHGVTKAKGRSRGTNEEATAGSQAQRAVVWISTVASQAKSSGQILGLL